MPAVIAPSIVTALTSVGVGATTAAIAGQFIAGAAIAIGASAAVAALSRTQTDRSGTSFAGGRSSVATANSPEVRGSVKQATPPQRIAFGETRIGGAFYFYKALPPYIYVGHLHSILPITKYVQPFVGETAIGPLNRDSDPYVPLEAPYDDHLEISVQTGTIDQPINPLLLSDFPSDLDDDFRLPGMPNTVWKADYGADFDDFQALWGNVQIPDFQWVVQGAPIYDPRDPTQRLPNDLRDVDDLWDAISTWKYTNTAALIQGHWAMMPYGLNAGLGRVRWDEVAKAADFDDEIIPLKDGTVQKRHTIDGVVTLNEQPLTILEGMIISNRGFVTIRAGQVLVRSSQPQDPIFTLTDDHLVGAFTFRDASPKRELVNWGHTVFIAPDRQYQDAEGPSYKRDDLITKDGEVLDQTVRMPFVSTHQRAQRLLKAYVTEKRLGKQVTGAYDLRAIGCVIGSVVRVWSELFPSSNGIYTVEGWELAEDLSGVGLALTEYNAAISRDWNAQTDEQDFILEVEDL